MFVFASLPWLHIYRHSLKICSITAKNIVNTFIDWVGAVLLHHTITELCASQKSSYKWTSFGSCIHVIRLYTQMCVCVCVCLSVCVLLHIHQAKHMYTRHQAKHSCAVSRRVVWWCCLWSRTRTRHANQCYTWYVKWTTGSPNIFLRIPKRPPTIKGLLECTCISR